MADLCSSELHTKRQLYEANKQILAPDDSTKRLSIKAFGKHQTGLGL